MQKVVSIFLVFLSLVGLADATYLTWNKLNNTVPPCGLNTNCDAVLTSSWATIGHIPISALGMLFYAIIFLLAVMQLGEVRLGRFTKRFRFISIPELLLIFTSIGLVFSGYLVSIMAFVIGQWCQYCLLSAGTTTLLFLLSLVQLALPTTHSPFSLKGIWFWIFGWLYRLLGKPILFLFDPEFIHHAMIDFGVILGKSHITKSLTATSFAFRHPSLATTLNGVTFPNPVGLSAGYDYDGDMTQILPSIGFGWHTIGTVTQQAYAGNPKPRLGRFPKSKALLVNKGLKSIGAPAVITKLTNLPLTVPTCISIASTNTKFANDRVQIKDMLDSFRQFEASKVKHHLYELNISCPNTFGGEPFTTPQRLETLLRAVDKLDLSRPLFVKMPIDLSAGEMVALLKVLNNHNVQGLNIGNLTKNRNNPLVDPEDRKDWKQKKGNLSGKPTWDLSNKHIRLTRKTYKNRFTIIGTGGIFSGADAQHKLDLGADLVQLITGMIYGGPHTIGSINRHLAKTSITRGDE